MSSLRQLLSFKPFSRINTLSSCFPILNRQYHAIGAGNFQPILTNSMMSLTHKCSFTTSFPFRSIDPSKNMDNSEGIIQRFKNAYKIYGKTLVVVHVFTSCIWLLIFYLLAAKGVDVSGLLSKLSAPDWILKKFDRSTADHAGTNVATSTNWLLAYLFYKMATPLRYPVTLGLTRLVVVKLRSRGHFPKIAEQDKLRNLAKESIDIQKARIQRRKAFEVQRARDLVNQKRNQLNPFRSRKHK